VGELKHFLSDKAKFEPLDPARNIKEPYAVQSVQYCYKYSDSVEEAFETLKNFGKSLNKGATMSYDPVTK